MSTSPRKAAIYLRISQDRTGREAGVKRQEKDCRDLVERLGWELAAVHVDNDVSAYNGKRRPGYEHARADLEHGRANALVAWHPDRLYRRAAELEALVDLINRVGAEVATVKAGAVDLSTPNGRLVARIGAAVAQHESEHKGERVARWHQDRAEAGLPGGGPRPFGYCDDRITPHETEAPLIVEAAERVLAGEKRYGIVCDWNRRGIRTVTGKTWSTTRLSQQLRSPRIAGLRQHNGKHHPAAWPAIVPRETWDALQAALTVEHARPGPPARYPLTGILRCGLCDTLLVGNRTHLGARVYRCAGPDSSRGGCGKIGRNAEHLEAHLRNLVAEAIASPKLRRALSRHANAGRDDQAALKELVGLEERLARLKTEYAVEDLWSKAEFTRMRGDLENKIGDVAGRLAADRAKTVSFPVPAAEEMEGWWGSAHPDEQRALVGMVIDRVLVHPVGRVGRHGFDPSAIEVVWRA